MESRRNPQPEDRLDALPERQDVFFDERGMEGHSAAVQEILGRPPGWMVRWGIMTILMVVLVLLIGSAYVRYPDVVRGTITVTTENLPVSLSARMTGKIDTILVCDRAQVMRGALLAVLENAAEYGDVERMKAYMEGYRDYMELYTDTILFSPYPMGLSLGELQPAFYQFVKALKDYQYFLETGFYQHKHAALGRRKSIQEEVVVRVREQLLLERERLEAQERMYRLDSLLFASKAITRMDYEVSYTALLQMRQTYANAMATVNTAMLSVAQLEQEMWEVYEQERERGQELYLSLSGAYGELVSQLEIWEQNYVFRSPIEGTVALTTYWQKNQHVTTGEVLMSVVPEGEIRMIGKLLLSSQGIGKVRVGQRVNIKFPDFPHMEYGMVGGEVSRISMVPVKQEERLYRLVEVRLPENLETNYGRRLVFSQEMQGEAEIITEDLRVLDRMLNPIKSALRR